MYTIYRTIPVVWRSDSCVQFGADDPVLIDGLSPADVDLLNVLRMGVSADHFFDAAARCSVSGPRATSLLTLLDEAGVLAPVSCRPAHQPGTDRLEAYAASLRAVPGDVAHALTTHRILVSGPLRAVTARTLRRAGMRATAVESSAAVVDADSLVVLTSVWAADLLAAGQLCEEGISHLHVIVGTQCATVSQLIVPGAAPCSGCRVAAACDADSGWLQAWRSLRAQQPSPSLLDPVLLELTLAHTATAVRSWALGVPRDGGDLRIDIDAGTAMEEVAFHSACDCRVPLAPSVVEQAG